MDKCSVLLSTCDSYVDTWEPFFVLMDRYWKECPYSIYINTETMDYMPSFKTELRIKALHPKKAKCQWGERIIDVLKQIDSEYIFLVLDDFFLKSCVNQEVFELCIKKLDEDVNLASIQLNSARLIQEEKIENSNDIVFKEIPKSGWKTHFNPTIWRKSVLLSWLRKHESIWGFELYGSQRARRWHYKETVLSLENPTIFDYLWVDNCSVIVNGKWLASQVIDDFFKTESMDIDLNVRGRITLEEYRSRTLKDTLKKLTFKQKVERVIARIRSIF